MKNKQRRLYYYISCRGYWYVPSLRKWEKMQNTNGLSFQSTKVIKTVTKAFKMADNMPKGVVVERILITKNRRYSLGTWERI
jgi:hypothetical protein